MKINFATRTVAIAAIVVTMCLAAGTAWAFRGDGPRGQAGPLARVRAVLSKLDLSADQQARIKEIAEAARPAMREARERLRADRDALKAAVDTANPDPTAIGNATLKVKSDREAVRAEMKKLHDATVTVLTPEQKVKFEAYLDAFRMARRGRPGGPRS